MLPKARKTATIAHLEKDDAVGNSTCLPIVPINMTMSKYISQ